jgi:hypothetical protein
MSPLVRNSVLKETLLDKLLKYPSKSVSDADNSNALAYDVKLTIDDYMSYITKHKLASQTSCLDFWWINEDRWPILAKVAKKVLGVPASSANVERLFSLSGHINNPKRRRMTPILFAALVYNKLNEFLLKFVTI